LTFRKKLSKNKLKIFDELKSATENNVFHSLQANYSTSIFKMIVNHFCIGFKPLESEDLSYFYSYFHKNQEQNPCFQVILGLGIRGFGIRGIFLERNPRE